MTKRSVLFIILAMLLLPVLSWAQCTDPNSFPQGKGAAYEHINCGGWNITLTTNTNEPDLRHWGRIKLPDGSMSNGQNINDMISSIVLGNGIKCEFYTDINYKGSKIGPLIKGTYDMKKSGYNDKISSIKCYVP